MEPVWKLEVLAVMPSGIVEEQDGGIVTRNRALLGEGIEDGLEQGDIDRVGYPPFHVAGGRSDEGMEVEPFVLVAARRHGPPPLFGPDPANDRLQPEAMLVESPDFDPGGWFWALVPGALVTGGVSASRRHGRGEFFLNRPCSSGLAALA